MAKATTAKSGLEPGIEEAQELILRAAEILRGKSSDLSRIAWMLEDVVPMMHQALREEKTPFSLPANMFSEELPLEKVG